MTMSRDEARILISSLIEWYTEDVAERLGMSMGKDEYMDALEVLWHGPEGELIRRADAIEAVRMSEHRITIADEQGGFGTVKWDMWGVYTAEAVEAIKALPSAEAVQGEWIMHGEPPWYVRECSECGTKWHQWSGDANPNYCGHCGARMIGGAE